MIAPQRTQNRRKYGSLLISIIFHSLCVLFFFYWATVRKEHTQPFVQKKRSTGPAKVSFQKFPTQNVSHPSTRSTSTAVSQGVAPKVAHTQPSSSFIPSPQAAPLTPPLAVHPPKKVVAQKTPAVPSSKPKPLAIPSKPTAHKELPLRSTSIKEAPKLKSKQQHKETILTKQVPVEQKEPLTPSFEEVASKHSETSPSQPENTAQPASAASRRPAITGAALMNAFKRSFYTEREEERQDSTSSTGSYSGPTEGPAHVTQRLKEWDYSSYQRKINQALIKATRLHKKYISVPLSVHERLAFRLVINQEGQLRAEPLQPPTGIDEIDTYITQFFTMVDPLPIPKRFNLKEFSIHVTIQLTLSQGGHFLQLKPMAE